MPLLLILLIVSCSVAPAGALAQWDSTTATLLTRGDTGAALAHLRQHAQATDTPESWCALARVLTATATTEYSSWQVRYEASEACARGLRGGDVQCLYGHALLKEKQGTRADRRALLMDDWLRKFDYLVNLPATLPVSTPGCLRTGYFCENFFQPRMFNARFVHAPSLASVISDDRRLVVQLLDSALSLDPVHARLLDAPVPAPILNSRQGVGTTLLSQHARMRVQLQWPVSCPTGEGRRHC